MKSIDWRSKIFSIFNFQNELDSALEALKIREKLLESQLMVSSLNDILCENGNYLKENAKVYKNFRLKKNFIIFICLVTKRNTFNETCSAITR